MKVPWKQARMVVEPQTLEVMEEWRGEDNTSELEGIFKETIVIDDDDDDDDDEDDNGGDSGTSSSDDDGIDQERHSSLEIVFLPGRSARAARNGSLKDIDGTILLLQECLVRPTC